MENRLKSRLNNILDKIVEFSTSFIFMEFDLIKYISRIYGILFVIFAIITEHFNLVGTYLVGIVTGAIVLTMIIKLIFRTKIYRIKQVLKFLINSIISILFSFLFLTLYYNFIAKNYYGIYIAIYFIFLFVFPLLIINIIVLFKYLFSRFRGDSDE